MDKSISARAMRCKHVALAVTAAFLPSGQSYALPTGEQLVAGDVTVTRPTAQTMQINQATQKGIVNWLGFSIGASEHVNITQPNASASLLNRVVGNNPSEIFGRLTANGRVFLVNPNGVLFAPGASVDVGSLFASSLALADQDFLAGRYQFSREGNAGSVVNQGTIITANGYTGLIGPQVRNDGVIIANSGKVALAAGDRVSLDMVGDGLVSISVDQAAFNASVVNTGTILADGGTVMLKASSANALFDTVINTSGVIRAMSLVERNGEIVLDAAPNGGIVANGEMQAGQVSISGGSFHLQRLVPDPSLLKGLIAAQQVDISLAGAMTVDTGQIHSQTGQDIAADSLTVRAQEGGFATVRNESGNQVITVTGANGMRIEGLNGGGATIQNQSGNQIITASGAGGIHVEATNGSGGAPGSAILGKPFFFGGPPATDSQTISATRINVRGGSIQANEQDITATAGVVVERGSISTLAAQKLSVHGDLSLQGGSIGTSGGNQTIAVTGGSIDVTGITPGFFTSISASGTQSITVTNGDHINVVANAGNANLSAQGTQTISITGNSGANAIRVGAPGAVGISQVGGRSQSITAGEGRQAGRIDIFGVNAPASFAGIVSFNAPGAGNTQTVSTSGTVTVQGGNAPFQNLVGTPPALTSSNAGIFHNSSGQQTIDAGGIVLQGGTGINSGAFIGSSQGGSQRITVPGGSITIEGGTGGSGNRAGIVTNANQTINGGDSPSAIHPTIVLRGGGGSANSAAIQATSTDVAKLQKIRARSIALGGGSASDASASFNAVRQDIATTAGNLTLQAGLGLNAGVRIGGLGGNNPSSTDLKLTVAGDLLMNGGAGDGVSLASSTVAPFTQFNKLEVSATGDIVLRTGSGGGARIGAAGSATPTNPGDITVSAGKTLDVGAGTAIRATGPVSLLAETLINDGTISNGGGSANMLLSANVYDLAGGNVQGGSAAVLLRPRDGTRSFGIEAAGTPTLTNHTDITNADIASISTSNFIVFGSGMASNFTGDMTIGQDAQVNGAGKNLAFLRSMDPGGTTTIGSHGVTTTGDVIVSAGGGRIVGSGGTVAGDEVQLRASQGIGAPFGGQQVRTAAGALAVNNTGPQGAYILENDNVTLRTIALTVGGPPNAIPNVFGNSVGGTFELATNGGSVDIAGVVSTGTMSIAASGAISESAGGAILANTLNTSSGGATNLGGPNQISNFSGFSNGALSLTNSGALTVNSFFAMLGNGTLTNAGDVSVTGAWNSQAAKIDTTGNLTVTGSVSSNGFMEIDVDGTLTVTASGQLPPPTPGFPGIPKMASLTSNGGQDIDAGGIKITASDGASASISNNGAPSTINTPAQKIVVGAGGIEVSTAVPASLQSSARISNSTGNQEITVSGGGISVISTSGNASIRNSGPFLPPPPPVGGTPPPPSGGGTPPPPPAGGVPPSVGGSQTITVSGGAGIDVIANGGSATITQDAQGLAQSITAINADHIALDARAGLASIGNSQGAQTISITGTGNNVLKVGSEGGEGLSQVFGRSQVITAGANGEAGRIDLVGASAPAAFVGITTINPPPPGNTPGQTQTVSTSGVITIQGGNSLSQNPVPTPGTGITSSTAGIFHNSSGQQTIDAGAIVLQGGTGINNGAFIGSNQGGSQQVTATNITLRGGAAGTNSAAGINSTTGGDQTITATDGSIMLVGGSGGANNGVGIRTNATQTISGNPDIVLRGGTGSGAGGSNGAAIAGSGAATRTQTINAATIELASGADNSATINGATQVITTTGDLRLTGSTADGSAGGVRIGGIGGQTPGASNVTLRIGGHLLLTAGGTNNSAAIGSALPPPNVAPTSPIVDIVAGGDVILQASDKTGVRIGTSFLAPTAAEGNISVRAGGSIELHGLNGDVGPAVIRTASDVTLVAGSGISQSGSGRVLARRLSATADGDIALGGPNALANFNAASTAGDVILNNSGALNVTGMNAFGDATITNLGTVTVSGPWTARGTSTITVGSDILLRSAMQSHEVLLVSTTGGIDQDAGASITAETLTTSSLTDTVLEGTNAVETINVSSTEGNVRVNTASDVLKLHNMSLPGALVVNNAGAIEVSGHVSALSHDLSATGNVTVGGANANGTTLLYAPGFITISTPGSIRVHGSDTSAGAGSVVIAGGALTFNAGDVSIRGGAAFATPSAVRGSMVNMALDNLHVTGGSGHLSPAWLSSGTDISLTVGDAVRLQTGAGLHSWAKVQTETRDGEIRMTFPNRTAGGYFVDGVEGSIKHGQTGFYTLLKPVKVGDTLLLCYGDC